VAQAVIEVPIKLYTQNLRGQFNRSINTVFERPLRSCAHTVLHTIIPTNSQISAAN